MVERSVEYNIISSLAFNTFLLIKDVSVKNHTNGQDK